MASEKILDFAFDKIDVDLVFIMDCFREVLEELGEVAQASRLPWIDHSDAKRTGKATSTRTPTAGDLGERDVQVLSVAFQLLNMVEENAAAQSRRRRESTEGMLREPGLWGQNLRQLLDAGFTAEQIAETLPLVRVEPVLTAHPTEAKRSTVLEQHRHLYLLLVKRENQMWTPAEQQTIRDEVKLALERLWRTGELRLAKPDVASERRGVLHYLREIFPEAVPRLDDRLHQAWREAGCDPALLVGRMPRISFGTWVGLRYFAANSAVNNAAWPTAGLIGSLALNLGLLMLCWAAIGMAIGCGCRRRGSAGAIAGLLALTGYLTDYVGRAWKPADSVAWLSPFRYYMPFELVMGSDLSAKNLYVLGGITAAAFGLAYLFYSRRDISQ